MLYDKRWEQKHKPKAWQQLLLDAADLIEHEGWCQETTSYNGPHCALGAILAARGEQGTHVAHVAEAHLFAAVGAIVHWNDQPERTATEVVATLQAVAKAYH